MIAKPATVLRWQREGGLEGLAEGQGKAQAWAAATGRPTGQFDRADEPVQFPMGCASAPRRTAQAWTQGAMIMNNAWII